jgi:hypothetical protein
MPVKDRNRVLGRWLETLGIGLVARAIVTLPLSGIKYWYFLILSVIVQEWDHYYTRRGE